MSANSVTSLNPLDKKDSPRKERVVLVAYFVYAVTYVALVAAFITWLIDERQQTRDEFGLKKSSVWVETTPTFLATGIALVVAPLFLILSCFKSDEVWPTGCFYTEFSDWFKYISYFWGFVGTFFGIQIIVFMCLSAQQYLDVMPSKAACYCVTPDPVTLPCPTGATFCSPGALRCQCRVPFYDNKIIVAVSSVGEINKELFTYQGVDWSGPIDVLTKTQAATADSVPWLKDYTHLNVVFLLIQLSWVLTTMRVPLTIGTAYVLENGQVEGASLVMESAVTCLFIITESLDAFTLLEELLSSPDYFTDNVHLTNAVLAFVSLAILLMNTVSMPRAMQMGFLLLINIGFLAIRSVLYDRMVINAPPSGTKWRLQIILLLFIVKAVVIILLALVYLVYSLINACTPWFSFGQTQVEPAKDAGVDPEEGED